MAKQNLTERVFFRLSKNQLEALEDLADLDDECRNANDLARKMVLNGMKQRRKRNQAATPSPTE